MKNLFLAVAAIAMVFATSCQKENVNEPALSAEDNEFVCVIDQNANPQNAPAVNDDKGTLAHIDGSNNVWWQVGDEIAYYGIENTQGIGYYTLTCSATSDNKAYFSAPDKHFGGGEHKAYYPASLVNNGTLTLPSAITLDANKNAAQLPMYGEGNGSHYLTFHNMCAALKITVPVACDEIQVSASTNLCGAFTVNNNKAELSDKTGSSNNTITVTGSFTENQVVYVAIPEGTYNDFKVTLHNGTSYSVSTAKNIQLEANKIYGVSFAPATDCFHFEAIDAGATIKMYAHDNVSGLTTPQLEYSTDGYIWNTYTFDQLITMANVGDKVYFRAPVSHPNTAFANANGGYWFQSGNNNDKKVKVAGNIMTLLNGTNPPTDFGGHSYVFRLLMRGCRSIRDASGLILPDVTAPYCYSEMFFWAEIDAMPSLPALTMTDHCYYHMFDGCYITSPSPIVLPATTLANQCYEAMFCSSANLANNNFPDVHIKATDLNGYRCCYDIFHNCTYLHSNIYFYTTSFPTNNECVYHLFGSSWGIGNPVVHYVQGANINDVWNTYMITAVPSQYKSNYSYQVFTPSPN